MEEYLVGFENLMIKGDLLEAEEQFIVLYLVDLRFEISKTIQLQPWGLDYKSG